VLWGHTFPGPEGFVDMLLASHVSGLAFRNDACHLCIHPVYGPWLGLRAVVVFDADGSDFATRKPLEDPTAPEVSLIIHDKVQQLLQGGVDQQNWGRDWRQWLEVRQLAGSCVSPEHHYSEAQILYHYTKDKAVLLKQVQEHTS